MTDLPPAIALLLQRQHGLVTRDQCRQGDLDDVGIRRLIRSGRWEKVAPSVFAVSNHRTSWVRSLWLTHLRAGPASVVSHESAGRLHGFAQVKAGQVVVTVPTPDRSPVPGSRHHVSRDLERDHVTTFDGLPVTTLDRTVIDLSARLHVATLRELVDHATVDRRTSIARLGAMLADVRRSGRAGVRKLSMVLDELGPGEGMSRSELERLLDGVIDIAGIPRPVHEYPLPGRGAVNGFVDRCWPEAKLIVEADGRKWHARRQQSLLDSTRSFEAQAAGFETSRLLWEHLADAPDATAHLLRAVYLQRAELSKSRSPR